MHPRSDQMRQTATVEMGFNEGKAASFRRDAQPSDRYLGASGWTVIEFRCGAPRARPKIAPNGRGMRKMGLVARHADHINHQGH
jgi:hypothetical protein